MSNVAATILGIVTTLRQAVAAFLAAQARPPMVVWLGTQAFTQVIPPPRHAPLPEATWHLLDRRLMRLAGRLHALFARWQAGTLPAPLAPPPPRAPRPPTLPTPRLPTRHGWIHRHVPEAGRSGGMLHDYLLGDALRPFVAAAPQSGRLLRPLCRLLAVEIPPWLRLPLRPQPPRAKSHAPARPVRSHPARSRSAPSIPAPPDPPDRPLPAYVRAAARAWNRKNPRRP